MPRRDLWGECYAGEHQQHLGPEDFKRLFCRLCRNPECVNSASGQSRWANRIETQVDRLLDNPIFADLNDPRFEALRKIDFGSAIREAISLELSTRKSDWSIPTEEEIDRMADEMVSSHPVGYQAPDPTEGEPEDEDPEVEILWEGEAKGSKKGTSYKVTLARVGNSEPTWSCTCPATQYGKAPPGGCKHVVAAMGMFEEQREQEVEVVEEEIHPETPTREVVEAPPRGVDPATWKEMRDRHLVPKSPNTPAPAAGVMVGGAPPSPEPEDPWAAPSPPEPQGEVVAVGGKVVMGGAPSVKNPK